MPRLDGTGPRGMGAGSGCGRGRCSAARPGQGLGRGFGMGRGRGGGRCLYREDSREALEAQRDALQAALSRVEEKLQ